MEQNSLNPKKKLMDYADKFPLIDIGELKDGLLNKPEILVEAIRYHEMLHRLLQPKSQLSKEIAAELGISLEDDVNFAPPSVRKANDDCCHRWKVNVSFVVCITSPKMPDEEAIKRALKNQIIYDVRWDDTDNTIDKFIEDMDWDDPIRE